VSLRGLLAGCALLGGCAFPQPEWTQETQAWRQRATPVHVAVVPAQTVPRVEFKGRPGVPVNVGSAAAPAAAAAALPALCAAGALATVTFCISAVLLGSFAGGAAAADALRPELAPLPGLASHWPATAQVALAEEFSAQLRAAGGLRVGQPADIVAETSLQRLALLEQAGTFGTSQLHVTGDATMRVVRTRDDSVLAERSYSVSAGRGAPGRYRQDGKALAAAVGHLLGRLAEQMSDDILHGVSAYADRPPAPEQPVARPCAGHSLECERNVIIPELEAAMLVFRWRPAELQAGSGSLVYDFRLVGPGAVPASPLERPYPLYEHHYIRYGLETPQHQLQVPLAPCASYRWSVRARTIEGAHMQVTPWSSGEMRVIGDERGEPFRTKC